MPDHILDEAIVLKGKACMDPDAPTWPLDVARLLVNMGIGLVMVQRGKFGRFNPHGWRDSRC